LISYLNNFLFDFYKEYTYSLFLLNITIYLFLLFNIFALFFLIDIRFVKTLNELKLVGGIQSFSIFVVLTLMSFAGVPPLFGFSGKFLIFITLFSKSNWLFIFLFSFLNIFLMYFYIQNFRFITTKKINDRVFFKNNFGNNDLLISILMGFNFINLFGIIYI
jgi:NADH:ubiquinone oxidoreductase subunit 2 (subunit N)